MNIIFQEEEGKRVCVAEPTQRGDGRDDGAEGNKAEASIWERLDWLTLNYKSWLHHKLKNTFYHDGAMDVLYFAVV